MPKLPKLTVVKHCPDDDCNVPIGTKHTPACRIALCVMTGRQRLQHDVDAPPPPEMPIAVTVHTCGEDVWAGYPHGTVSAAANGMFARPARPDDPDSDWIPCEPGHPHAIPDVPRLIESGSWNPFRQVFELQPAAVTT